MMTGGREVQMKLSNIYDFLTITALIMSPIVKTPFLSLIYSAASTAPSARPFLLLAS